MKREWLSLSEGVGYNNDAMPEPVYDPDIAADIDAKNGWVEPGGVSADEEAERVNAARIAKFSAALDVLAGLLGWLTAGGMAPMLIEQRTHAAMGGNTQAAAESLGVSKWQMRCLREAFLARFPMSTELERGAVAGLMGWLVKSGGEAMLVKQRIMAALYVVRPAALNPRTLPKIAAQLGIQKQRLHNHIADFRAWSGIHKFERPIESRERMAAASRANWTRRKAAA